MVNQYKTIIKDFGNPYFVSAFASLNGLEALEISKQKGITCGKFKTDCASAFEVFRSHHEYSLSSVESFFKLKFCHVRVEKSKIQHFQDRPSYGSNIIYVNKR